MELFDKDIKQILNSLLDNFNDYNETQKIYELLKDKDVPFIKDYIEYIPCRYVVALGGDGWAYDIGYNGIDHVLCSNENIKIMILDTEIYSNTGGQTSKSSQYGQSTKFDKYGKHGNKKDIFRLAMNYPNTYVASINAMKEAFEHNGPSIIICYSPCMEHGIKGGMGCSLKEAKLANTVGYSLMMRYNPEEDKLYLDSKEPDFDKYNEFLDNEKRYATLKTYNISYEELLEINKNNAIERYNYYKNISNNNK